MHKYERAQKVARWRKAFHALALEQNMPLLENIHVYITPFHKDRRWVADVGNVYPSFKAALDGLRDAGVMVDDNPDWVKYVGFHEPVIGDGDGLELVVVGDEAGPDTIKASIPVPKRQPRQVYNNGRKKSATRGRKKPRIP
jgi:hypothetical protein